MLFFGLADVSCRPGWLTAPHAAAFGDGSMRPPPRPRVRAARAAQARDRALTLPQFAGSSNEYPEENDGFEVGLSTEKFFFTFNPRGYLRKRV